MTETIVTDRPRTLAAIAATVAKLAELCERYPDLPVYSATVTRPSPWVHAIEVQLPHDSAKPYAAVVEVSLWAIVCDVNVRIMERDSSVRLDGYLPLGEGLTGTAWATNS